MKIRYYCQLMVNAVRVLLLRMRFRSSIKVDWFQLLGKRFSMEISQNGTISLGRKVHTRCDTHLIAQGGSLKIGNNVFMNNNVAITALESIRIEDNVTIANNVVIVDHDHDMNRTNSFITDEVVIEEGAWIGANSVILKGVRIGKGSVVAAGSVITKSVEPFQVVAGVPAKVLKSIDKKGK